MKTLLTIAAIGLLITSCKKKDVEPTTPQPVTSVGASYAGGTVFYLSADGQHGMVVTQDLGTYPWSVGPDSSLTNCDDDFGTGLQNTQNIVTATGSGSYAAKVCLDLNLNGYSDWYLPSKEELYKVYQNETTNGFSGTYWSSTEVVYQNSSYGWFIKWGPGIPFSSNMTDKSSQFKVRAVRNF